MLNGAGAHTYQFEDCSDFVIQNVLPQLDLSLHEVSLLEAQAAMRVFLGSIEGQLEVYSDAQNLDWDFFRQLAYVDHKWPSHVANMPTNLIHLYMHFEAENLRGIDVSGGIAHSGQWARLIQSAKHFLNDGCNVPGIVDSSVIGT